MHDRPVRESHRGAKILCRKRRRWRRSYGHRQGRSLALAAGTPSPARSRIPPKRPRCCRGTCRHAKRARARPVTSGSSSSGRRRLRPNRCKARRVASRRRPRCRAGPLRAARSAGAIGSRVTDRAGVEVDARDPEERGPRRCARLSVHRQTERTAVRSARQDEAEASPRRPRAAHPDEFRAPLEPSSTQTTAAARLRRRLRRHHVPPSADAYRPLDLWKRVAARASEPPEARARLRPRPGRRSVPPACGARCRERDRRRHRERPPTRSARRSLSRARGVRRRASARASGPVADEQPPQGHCQRASQRPARSQSPAAGPPGVEGARRQGAARSL